MVTAMRKQDISLQNGQGGAALIVSLLLLLVMTIIGVTAMQTNILEEKMAGNDRDISLSLQAAEAALRAGEATIEGIVSPAAAFNGETGGHYPEGSDVNVFSDATWTADNSLEYGADIENIGTRPRYIIEFVGEIGTGTSDVNIGGYGETSGQGTLNSFLITARGTGGSDTTVTLLQSYYAKRF